MTTKEERRKKIKQRVRSKIVGTTERPRLTVFRSNKQIYAQIIDDTKGVTLTAVSSLKLEKTEAKKLIAAKVGEQIANGYLYHGRIKELADAARNGGLKF